MEHILVGNKECFGIELKVRLRSPGVFADVSLWIGGESLGSEDDAVALHALLGTLDGLSIRASRNSSASGASSFQAAALWENFETVGRKYSVDSSEFFDRYEMYCVADEQIARFLWRERSLEPSPFTQVEIELGELRRIGAYSRAFVASAIAPVAEYGIAISDELDRWLAEANVPFEATTTFFQVDPGRPAPLEMAFRVVPLARAADVLHEMLPDGAAAWRRTIFDPDYVLQRAAELGATMVDVRIPGWEQREDDELVGVLLGSSTASLGELLVITDVCLGARPPGVADVGGAFVVEKGAFLRFMAEYKARITPQLIDGDVIVVAPEERRIEVFHHEGMVTHIQLAPGERGVKWSELDAPRALRD